VANIATGAASASLIANSTNALLDHLVIAAAVMQNACFNGTGQSAAAQRVARDSASRAETR
jgi:hypothetical protein